MVYWSGSDRILGNVLEVCMIELTNLGSRSGHDSVARWHNQITLYHGLGDTAVIQAVEFGESDDTDLLAL